MGRVTRISVLVVLAVIVFAVAANAQASRTMEQQSAISGVTVTSSGNIPILKQHPLTSAQKQRIAELRYSNLQQTRQIQANTSMSASQKSARIQQIHRQSLSDIMSVLTPAQRTELRNSMRSRRGAGAGAGGTSTGKGAATSTPAVGVGDLTPFLKQHPLTSSQKQRIITLRRQEQQRIRQINSNTSLSTQQKTTQIQQIQQTTRQQVMNVLTTAQKKELAQSVRSRAGTAR